MMNTRALMALIVINIGYDLGIIPNSVFFMLVFMAVVTTYMTSPILQHLIKKTELEPLFKTSEFMQQSNWHWPSLIWSFNNRSSRREGKIAGKKGKIMDIDSLNLKE